MDTSLAVNSHSLSSAIKNCLSSIELYPTLPIVKRDILIKWRKIIKKIQYIPAGEHTIPMTIGLPTGVFSYQFELPIIYAYLIANEVTPITLPVNLLTHHVRDFDQSKLELSPDPDPIIMLETPLIPRGYLYSGHHNVFHAHKNKQKELEVYVLSENEFIGLMEDDLSKCMYMFHRDLQTLITNPGMPSKNELYFYMASDLLKDMQV